MTSEADGRPMDQRVLDEDLADLEAQVSRALQSRDLSALNVIGFGEVSVALGLPAETPRNVCKRTPPLTANQYRDYRDLVLGYVDELRRLGVDVVRTEVRAVERDGKKLAYLVQPLMPSETLGHNVLRRSDPHPDNPFLVALSETIGMASPTISIDAQVTNWSWDGSTLTLIDIGSPFLWDEQGTLQFDLTPFMPMIPAPLRTPIRKDLEKMINRWQSPRGVAVDVLANLFREGLEQWIEPALEALNRTVGGDRPIDAAEAEAIYVEDQKTWPRLLKLKRMERAWQTKVR